jgi:hypothetical protein
VELTRSVGLRARSDRSASRCRRPRVL